MPLFIEYDKSYILFILKDIPCLRYLLLCAVLITSHDLPAQFVCGYDHVAQDSLFNNPEEIKRFQEYLSTYSFTKSKDIEVIPIALHIMRESDGSDLVSMEEIVNVIERTNYYFEPINLRFEICGDVNYLNDSNWLDYDTEIDHPLENPELYVDNSLNVYYLRELRLGDTNAAGLGGSRAVYIAASAVTSEVTLAHEIGHHYSLSHTHGRYNSTVPDYSMEEPETNGFPTQVYREGAVRYINESHDDNQNGIFDCLETGDGVCDTPAEPVFLGGNLNRQNCEYEGMDRDYFGDIFEPWPGNVMSYARCQENIFTPGQYARMKFVLESSLVKELCGLCSENQTEYTVSTESEYGKGSLNWALECNRYKRKSVVINFDIPDEENPVINYDRYSLLDFPNLTINGLNKANGKKVTITGKGLNFGDNTSLNVNNLIFKDIKENRNPLRIARVNELRLNGNEFINTAYSVNISDTDNIVISNNTFNGTGLILSECNSVYISENEVVEEESNGIQITSSTSVRLEKNRIVNNVNTGIRLNAVTNAMLDSNYIAGTKKSSNDFSGFGIYISESQSCELKYNTIMNNNYGLILSRSSKVDCSVNDILCNNSDNVIIYSNSNLDNPDRPEIVKNDVYKIEGKAGPNSEVFIYANTKDSCDVCGMERLLGSSKVNSDGVWAYDFEDDEVGLGDDLSVMSTLMESSSNLSTCVKAFVPIGCSSFTNTFPYENEFKGEDIDSLIILGSQLGYFENRECSERDDVLRFRAFERDPGESIFYTSTFDLTNSAFAEMSFDLAHGRGYTNRQITLSIYVSKDCGRSFEQVYLKSTYDGLRTTSKFYGETEYEPESCTDWRKEIIDLSNYGGESVLIRFQFTKEFLEGPNVFLDNLKIISGAPCPETNISNPEFSLDISESVISVCEGESVSLDISSTQNDIMWIIDGEFSPEFDPSSIQLSSNITASIANYFGCTVSDSVQVVVNQLPSIDLGEDIVACSYDEVMLSGSENLAHTWYKDGVVLSDDMSEEIAAEKSGTYKVEIIDDNNCSNEDEITVEIISPPKLTAVDDITICNNAETSILVDTDQEEFTLIFSGQSTVNNSSEILALKESGTYYVDVADTYSCSSQDTFELSVLSEIEVFDPIDTSICRGFGFSQTIAEIEGGSIQWSYDGVDQNSSDWTRSFDEPGEYAAMVTDTFGCVESTQVILDVLEYPEVSIALSNDIICPGTVAEVELTSSHEDIQWSRNDVAFNPLDDRKFELDAEGEYKVIVSNALGCTTTASVELAVQADIEIETFDDFKICAGDTATLSTQNNYSNYVWSLGNNVIFEDQADVYFADSGVYTFTVFDSVGCQKSEDLLVDVFGYSQIEILSGDQIDCSTGEAQISITTDAAEIEWFADNTRISPSDIRSFTVEESGAYKVVGRNEIGCKTINEFDVVVANPIEFNFEQEYRICGGDSLLLEMNIASGSTIEWTNNSELFSTETSSIIKADGNYTVKIDDVLGCSYQHQFDVAVVLAPTVTLEASDNIFCEGTEVNLIGSTNADNFIWFRDGSLLNEVSSQISTSESATYTFEASTQEGCTHEESLIIEFSAVPKVDLGDDRVLCEGSELNLSNFEDDQGSYSWFMDGVDLSQEGGELIVSTSGEYTLTVENTAGCIMSDMVEVSFVPGPFLEIDDSLTLCPGESSTVSFNTDATDLQVFFEDEEISFEGFSFEVSLPGKYRVVGKGDVDCLVEKIIEVDNYVLPTSELLPEYSICSNADLIVDSKSDGVRYEWELDGVLLDSGNSSLPIELEGSYTFRAYNSNDCFIENQFEVQFSEPPSIDIGTQFDLCEAGTLSLDFFGDAALYILEQNGNLIEESNLESFLIFNPGEYTLISESTDGCRSINSFAVLQRELPVIELNNQYTLCFGESIELDAGDGLSSYSWSTGEMGQVIRIQHPQNSSQTEQEISVSVTNEFGCMMEMPISLLFSEENSAIVSIESDSICFGESSRISVFGTESIFWPDLNSEDSVVVVSPEETTSYTIEYENVCTDQVESLTAQIYVSDGSDVAASADTCIISGQSLVLLTYGGAAARWQNDPSILTNTNQTSIEVAPTEDQTYTVIIEDGVGCEYEDQVFVCVEDIYDLLNPPNVLVPGNFDGKNDVLLFGNLESYPGSKLTVVDRWGNVLFEHSNYQQDERLFDGLTRGGRELQPGTYYYILNLPLLDTTIKSSLTIMK